MQLPLPEVHSGTLQLDENCSLSTEMEYSVGIADGSAMAASEITADALRPSFQSWNMNMDTGIMVLNFGEPVNSSSFIPGNLNFQQVENVGADSSAKIIALSATNVTVSR